MDPFKQLNYCLSRKTINFFFSSKSLDFKTTLSSTHPTIALILFPTILLFSPSITSSSQPFKYPHYRPLHFSLFNRNQHGTFLKGKGTLVASVVKGKLLPTCQLAEQKRETPPSLFDVAFIHFWRLLSNSKIIPSIPKNKSFLISSNNNFCEQDTVIQTHNLWNLRNFLAHLLTALLTGDLETVGHLTLSHDT